MSSPFNRLALLVFDTYDGPTAERLREAGVPEDLPIEAIQLGLLYEDIEKCPECGVWANLQWEADGVSVCYGCSEDE